MSVCSQSGISRVTLTGGEPMIAKNIDVLLERLSREESLEVEIETNGSVSLTAFRQIEAAAVIYDRLQTGREAAWKQRCVWIILQRL